MRPTNYYDILTSLEKLLDEMDSVVCYVGGLRESLRTGVFNKKYQQKAIYDEINTISEFYSTQMIQYIELIKLLNTIVI